MTAGPTGGRSDPGDPGLLAEGMSGHLEMFGLLELSGSGWLAG